MGMAGDHLASMLIEELIDGEAGLFAPDLGAEKKEEDEVPQLFAERLRVVALDGVDDLVGLFDEIRSHGAQTLLAIPWTAVGTAEPADEAEQFGEGRLLAGAEGGEGWIFPRSLRLSRRVIARRSGG